MSQTDFLPEREDPLRQWAAAFSQKLTQDPGAVGVSAAQAAAFSALSDDYAAALQLVGSPTTDTSSNRQRKNTLKKALSKEARALARQINAWPGVTNGQRMSLGLTLQTPGRSRLPVPAMPPRVRVLGVSGRRVEIRLERSGPSTKRAKPAGVQGAVLFTYVGDEPPSALSGWSFYGHTTQTKATLELDPSLMPGTAVWVSAVWLNPRLEGGPPSYPARAVLGEAGVSVMTGMKLAA